MKPGQYTSMFADTGTYSKEGFSRNFEESYKDRLKSIKQSRVFDFIRNTDERNEIVL
jgi:hypothetical protein